VSTLAHTRAAWLTEWLTERLAAPLVRAAPLSSQPLAAPGQVAPQALLWFAAAVLCLCALRLWVAGPWLQLDNDLGWHLAYGHLMLDSRALPGPDQWSWTARGQPYQLTQAGGEVLLAAAERLAGATGIGRLMSASLAATVCLVFASCCIAGARPWLAAGITLGALLPLWAGTARPAAFGWLLLAWLTLHAARLLRRANPGDALACAFICALWPSVHGSFPLGFAVMGATFLVAAALHRERRRAAAVSGHLPPRAGVGRWLAGCAGAALMASVLLTPYGPGDAWAAVWVVAQLETTRQAYFADWRPVHLLSGLGLPALWALLAMLILARRPGSSWALLAGCAAVAAIGLSAQRGVALAAILGAPLLARALSRPEPASACVARASPPSRSARAARGLGWCSAFGAAALLALPEVSPASVQRAEAAVYPVNVAAALVQAAPGRRLLCEAEQGGWWIRRHPQMLVSLDGRADLHPDQAYWRHDRIMQLRPGWQQALQELDPDAASVRKASALAGELSRSPAWRLVAQDENYMAFVRVRS